VLSVATHCASACRSHSYSARVRRPQGNAFWAVLEPEKFTTAILSSVVRDAEDSPYTTSAIA